MNRVFKDEVTTRRTTSPGWSWRFDLADFDERPAHGLSAASSKEDLLHTLEDLIQPALRESVHVSEEITSKPSTSSSHSNMASRTIFIRIIQGPETLSVSAPSFHFEFTVGTDHFHSNWDRRDEIVFKAVARALRSFNFGSSNSRDRNTAVDRGSSHDGPPQRVCRPRITTTTNLPPLPEITLSPPNPWAASTPLPSPQHETPFSSSSSLSPPHSPILTPSQSQRRNPQADNDNEENEDEEDASEDEDDDENHFDSYQEEEDDESEEEEEEYTDDDDPDFVFKNGRDDASSTSEQEEEEREEQTRTTPTSKKRRPTKMKSTATSAAVTAERSSVEQEQEEELAGPSGVVSKRRRIEKKKGDFECQLCREAFEFWQHLLVHVREEHCRSKCPECDLAFVGKGPLSKHLQASHPGVRQDSRRNLTQPERHARKYLQELNREERKREDRRRCEPCGVVFSAPKELHRHIKASHLKIRNEKCPSCDYCAARKARLTRHIKAVHESKQCEEEGCGRSFSSLVLLKKHVAMRHQRKQQQFRCEECSQFFSRASSLGRHVRNVHEGIKDHVCSRCGQRFARLSHLVRHERSVHDKLVRFKCSVKGCEFKTDRPYRLEQHKKSKKH